MLTQYIRLPDLLVAMITAFCLVLTAPAHADSLKSAKKSKQLQILGALADFESETLYIIGTGFDAKKSPVISLGALGDISELCAVDVIASPQVISCDYSLHGLPGSGDYLLSVSTGKGDKDSVDYALTIGAVGPKGDSGPVGATGPAGPPGVAGLQGVAGPAGPQGPTGETGPQGPAGAPGPAGPTGQQGPIGPAGPTGATGLQGVPGPTGAQGPVGPPGPAGATGPQGVPGPAGAPGPAGETGPQGAQGIAGPAGADGPTGPQGATGPIGPAGPQGPAGVLGHQIVRLNVIFNFSPFGQYIQTGTCPGGKRVLGGGFGHSNSFSNSMVLAVFSGPTPNTSNTSTSDTSWTVIWKNYEATSQNLNLALWMICADAAS